MSVESVWMDAGQMMTTRSSDTQTQTSSHLFDKIQIVRRFVFRLEVTREFAPPPSCRRPSKRCARPPHCLRCAANISRARHCAPHLETLGVGGGAGGGVSGGGATRSLSPRPWVVGQGWQAARVLQRSVRCHPAHALSGSHCCGGSGGSGGGGGGSTPAPHTTFTHTILWDGVGTARAYTLLGPHTLLWRMMPIYVLRRRRRCQLLWRSHLSFPRARRRE